MDGEAVPEPVSRQFINIFDLLPHEKVESLDPQKFEGSFSCAIALPTLSPASQPNCLCLLRTTFGRQLAQGSTFHH
jgi:hypothetical protein